MPFECFVSYFPISCVNNESQLTSVSYLSIYVLGKCLPISICNQDMFLVGIHLIHKYQLIVLQVDKMRERRLVIILNLFLLLLL